MKTCVVNKERLLVAISGKKGEGFKATLGFLSKLIGPIRPTEALIPLVGVKVFKRLEFLVLAVGKKVCNLKS